jgi:hypothetical protein
MIEKKRKSVWLPYGEDERKKDKRERERERGRERERFVGGRGGPCGWGRTRGMLSHLVLPKGAKGSGHSQALANMLMQIL